MPLSLDDLQTPQTKEQIREVLEELLAGADFPVTSWQDEGAARGLLEGQSGLGATLTERVAELAKMGFLSSSVATFLTALVKSHYDEDRYAAVAAVFPVDLVNSGGTTHGPLAAGSYLLKSSTGQVFENVSSIASVPGDATTTVDMRAQIAGAAGNITAQALTQVTPLAGVSAVYDGTLTTAGADQEGDPQLRSRARTKWATLRVEKIAEGVLNLARNAAPSIHTVTIDSNNPRGAGTVDVYLAAENATAGASDVAAVQTALDLAFFGNGDVIKQVQALAATTTTQNVTATIYVAGTTSAVVTPLLTSALADFFPTIPIGGFDLSPGPSNVIQRGQIIDALTEVPGVISVDLTDPSADVTVSPGDKVIQGTISFTVIVVGSSS